MMQFTVAAPALSPLNGKPILLNFDGAEMSSDAGLTLLRQLDDRRADLAGLVARCLTDLRAPGKVRHSLEDIIRFRIMMIAAGYEDGNDAAELHDDPAFNPWWSLTATGVLSAQCCDRRVARPARRPPPTSGV
jgi:hypothetical protein